MEDQEGDSETLNIDDTRPHGLELGDRINQPIFVGYVFLRDREGQVKAVT